MKEKKKEEEAKRKRSRNIILSKHSLSLFANLTHFTFFDTMQLVVVILHYIIIILLKKRILGIQKKCHNKLWYNII